MDVTVYSYPPGDPVLIDKIVNEFLSQGKFDKLRKECMADADTKPAYQNLQLRVENIVAQFLKKQIWKPDLNKNQLRDSLRKHILESGFLDAGINRIVDQIVNPNVLATVFMPEVEEVVYSYLSIPRPGDKLQKQCDSTNRNSNNKGKQPSPEDSQVTAHESDKEIKNKSSKPEENHSNGFPEKIKVEDTSDKTNSKVADGLLADQNVEMHAENTGKDMEEDVKHETEDMVTDQDSGLSVKEEFKPETIQEDANDKFAPEKMELPSDDSQESLSRMGVERLRISESDGVNAPDSDASIPLEINEKSMSDSRDSDDSIMNKMSPISQGRLTPEDMSIVDEEKEEKEEKEEREERKEKNPLTFIGRIPKIKRDDSESSKSSKKDETARLYMKSVYSSDESDSSKHSLSKSDSDDKKSKEKKKSETSSKSGEKYDKDKKYKEDEKRRKSDHHKSGDGRSHSKDGRSRDDKSRSRRDEKDKSHSRSRDEKSEKSRDKTSTGDKKSSSSSSSSHSRSKSSSHHRSVHKSGSHDKEHHRDDSRSRDKDRSRHDRKDKDKRDIDKRKKDEEKRKKSKSVDDHGKERNKRDDRRSTDRDSNERERDKMKDSGSNRMQSDGKKKEKDGKVDDTRKEKNQREESDRKEQEVEEERDTGAVSKTVESADLEMVEAVELECVSDGVIHAEMIIVDPEESVVAEETEVAVEEDVLDVTALCSEGALTKVQFPKVIDDFYVKFNSTGFRYFEDWETTKMDCEEEFKEYIDEAEKDLSLLSDDGSDYESVQDHIESESFRQGIVSNSLRGLGNFEGSLLFDPTTYDFYRWTSRQSYRRQLGLSEESDAKPDREANSWSPGLTEEDEIHCLSEKNKENQERDRKIRKSLKLLSRYHRKMGLKFKHGKEQHKFVRRLKKNEAIRVRSAWNNGSEEQAKWRVLNASENVESHEGVLKKDEPAAETVQDGENFVGELEEVSVNPEKKDSAETFPPGIVPKMDIEAKIRLYQIQSMRRTKSESGTQKTSKLARLSCGSREDEEDEDENVVDSEVVTPAPEDYIAKKIKKRGIRIGLARPKQKPEDLDAKTLQKKVNHNYNLPLSPESDDSTFANNGIIAQKNDPTTSQRKRVVDSVGSPVTTDLPAKKLKDHRRTFHQKYDSQDLYKPRPFSIGSKTRGRALRVEGQAP